MRWRSPSPTHISLRDLNHFAKIVASIQVVIWWGPYAAVQNGARLDIDLYGIPNCDTVKKARAWLAAQGRAYRFHDYKKDGADPAKLSRWADAVGWETLLNTRGTTFRKLPDGDRADIERAKALALMEAHPSLIKRPVTEHPKGLLVGFDAAEWTRALG